MILNLGPLGKSRNKMPPEFTLTVGGNTYTRSSFLSATNGSISGVGAYAETTTSAGIVNWTMALFTGATLTFQRVVDALDVFIVDSGESGSVGYHENAKSCGGDGGRGGKTYTHSAVPVTAGTNYAITIGTSNGTSSFGNKTASSGTRKSGGVGAKANDGLMSGTASKNGETGPQAFGDNDTEVQKNRRYGNGGGAGGARNDKYYVLGPSSGGASTAPDGGAYNSSGESASANTGDGGSGGGYDNPTYSESPGKAGGSGIVMIRNAR